MIPELSYVYHLTPADVWAMTTSQYAQYLRHLDDVRRALDG